MTDFAERTGLSSHRPQRRYLWTDAFAVCNFLGLARVTGEERFTALALRLVDQVHHALGRHRHDDPRTGWISGLSEGEGEAHPTQGGLRIGKALPERGADDPFDERREWDRDGQYFHYLTQWMHALDQTSRFTGDVRYNVWARELAETAHHAFAYEPFPGAPRRMYWKLSIDLKRPLVPATGQHDPLEGYVTALQLRATAASWPESVGGPRLEEETRQFAEMTRGRTWHTADPLGLGGLLIDAFRLEQLIRQGAGLDASLLEAILTAALSGLKDYTRSGELYLPAGHRLAFRELGLAIGLHAARLLGEAVNTEGGQAAFASEVRARIKELLTYAPLHDTIESFWRVTAHRRTPTWSEHRDINEVMLATSLAPDGFLVLPSPR